MNDWVRVVCPECGCLMYKAKPGSEVQFKCPRKKCPVKIIETKITDEESVKHTAVERRE